MRISILVALLLLPASAFAQIPNIHVGDDVRVYNDSTGRVVSGRITAITKTQLSIARYMDSPPTRLAWGEVHRVEIKSSGEWKPLSSRNAEKAAVRDFPSLNAAALAGYAAANEQRGNFFIGSFLSAVPVGFFGLCLFADCPIGPKLVPVVGFGGIAFTAHAAKSRADALSSNLPAGTSPYDAAFRDAYEDRLRARFRNQVGLGALLGTAVGFGALIALVSAYGSWD